MSTTFTRRPPMATSRRLRLVTGCAADCRRLAAKPGEGSAQQQFVKNIPAVVQDTLFRNSLRVGMVDFQLFTDFNFCLAFPNGHIYTPEPAWRERPYSFRFKFR